MTQEQRERVENALVSMIENVPTVTFTTDGRKSVSPEGMRAAAELTRMLIALEGSATAFSPGKLRGITLELPDNGRRR